MHEAIYRIVGSYPFYMRLFYYWLYTCWVMTPSYMPIAVSSSWLRRCLPSCAAVVKTRRVGCSSIIFGCLLVSYLLHVGVLLFTSTSAPSDCSSRRLVSPFRLSVTRHRPPTTHHWSNQSAWYSHYPLCFLSQSHKPIIPTQVGFSRPSQLASGGDIVEKVEHTRSLSQVIFSIKSSGRTSNWCY